MARAKSWEKRKAILQAAVDEIAEVGLSAATAKIAARAGIASGTLFTYFPTKEALFNELYRELKSEVYLRINRDFPRYERLENRVRHVWFRYMEWALEFPSKRKVSAQLHLSDVITAKTRERAASERTSVEALLQELDRLNSGWGLPRGFASIQMSALQEGTMEFLARHPEKEDELKEAAFRAFWRSIA